MCGIAGYFGLADPRATRRVTAMLRAQSHRGPDGVGLLAWDGRRPWQSAFAPRLDQLRPPEVDAPVCVLGHNWLAIHDGSPNARQPMTAGDHALAFNGEIYNFVELRDELTRNGALFHTRSDTEVLLELWRRQGAAGLPRLRGMFAFAAFDRREKAMWLARDPFSIKPLYFAQIDGGLWFASEIRSLHAAGVVRREIDESFAVASAAAGVNKFDDSATLYRNVSELPPGGWMRITLSGDSIERASGRHADLPPLHCDLEGDAATESLRAAFVESVQVHLRASRRIATCLSGGLDSTNLAWAIAKKSGRAAEEFTTFTIRTAGPEQSELHLAAEVAGAAGLPHVVLDDPPHIDPADVLAMVVAYEVPNHVIGPINQFLLLRQVAQHGATVVLDGQGGDELMSGYPWYVPTLLDAMRRRGDAATADALRVAYDRHATLPPETAAQFERMFHQPPAWVEAFMWQGSFLGRSREEILRLPSTQYYLAGGGEWTAFRQREYQRAELQYLLRQEDRLGMWFGLECRVPFVDLPLARVAARLTPQWLLRDGYLKYPLRALFADLPDAVRWNTRKRGFWETDTRRFDWIPHVGKRLALESPLLRRAFAGLEAGWDALSFDQHWRLMQLAVLERAATREDWATLCAELKFPAASEGAA